MQKLGRAVLIIVGGLTIFGACVLLAVNLYVQSRGTQARIQRELRQRFGAELTIGRISVTPWSGVKLSGITIAQAPGGTSTNFLEAENFALRVAFLSLFSKRLVFNEVSLVKPNVIWLQNAEGKWRLPDLRTQRRVEKQPRVASTVPTSPPNRDQPPPNQSPTESAGESATPPVEPALPPEPRRKAPTGFASEIHKVSIVDGHFRFLDRKNAPVADFDSVGFRASIRNAVALHGNARVARVALRDRLFLEQLKSPVRYDGNGLDLSQISAHVGGGDINAHFSIQPEAEGAPFHVDLKVRNAEADQLITESGGPSGVLQGKLDGTLKADGKTADADALSGSGELVLHDGQIRQYDLLVALGQIFQIEELTQLHLDRAEAKYHLSPGVVNIDELVLQSTNIRLSATGTVTFRGKLHLTSQLAINEKVRAQLFKPMRANFQPTTEPGYSAVDFEVTGTVERPKTNLLDKVVGRDLKDLVNSFFGGGVKGEKQRKKKAAQTNAEPSAGGSPGLAAPTPTPSPTITP